LVLAAGIAVRTALFLSRSNDLDIKQRPCHWFNYKRDQALNY
jgi:hypothetical protein